MGSDNKVVVAVIDSGIVTSVPELGTSVIKSTGFGVDNDGYITEYPQMEIKNMHGTRVALIIRHLCKDVRFISMNILNERLATDGRILIHALNEVFSYKPDIIHLSLGTTKWKHKFPLKRIVKRANRENIVIVAAAHNQGLVSYPAYIKGVIGVKAGMFTNPRKYYIKDNFFYAPFLTKEIPKIEYLQIGDAGGTSMSAAYITGHIACILKDKKPLTHEEIKALLVKNADPNIFPFSKGGDYRVTGN